MNGKRDAMKKTLAIVFGLLMTTCTFAVDYKYNSDGSVSFAWVKGDLAGLYTPSGTVVKLKARTAAETDSHYKTFVAAGVSFYLGEQYYWYYPYSTSHSNGAMDIPISYLGQMQTGNGSTAHLGAYDFMTSQTVISTATDAFALRHLGSIVRLKANVNTAVGIAKVEIASSDKKFVTEGKLNYKYGTVTSTSTDDFVSLQFAETVATEKEPLVAYLMVSPDDFGGSELTVTITTTDGQTATGLFKGIDFEAGKVYQLNMDVYSLTKTSATVSDTSAMEGDDEPTAAKNNIITAATIDYPLGYAPDFMPGIQVPTIVRELSAENDNDNAYNVSGIKVNSASNINRTLTIKGGKKIVR